MSLGVNEQVRLAQFRRNTWGVPSTDERAVLLPRIRKALDDWIDGPGMLLIDAPSGYGKTTQVARWLSTRPATEFAVWITATSLLRNWSGAIAALAQGLRDLGLSEEDNDIAVTEPAALYIRLAQLRKVVVLVIDGADELEGPADINRLEQEISSYPLVRPIVLTSRMLAGDPLLASPRRHTLSRHDLAWSTNDAKLILGHGAVTARGRIPVDELVRETGGHASAMLAYLAEARNGAHPGDLATFRARWTVQKIANIGSRAADLFFMMCQFLRVPADYVPQLGGEDAGEHIDMLLREGLIEAVRHPGMTHPAAFVVPLETREASEWICRLALGERAAAIHRSAAEYFVGEGEKAPAVFHLARLEQYGQALDLMKQPLTGKDITTGTEELRAAAASIPVEVLGADPEALALRLLLARLPPVEQSPYLRELQTRLVTLPRRATDELPLRVRMTIATAAIGLGTSRGELGRVASSARQLAEASMALSPEELSTLGREPSMLWASQAEAQMLDGELASAFEFARAAHQWAENGGHTFEQFLANARMASLFAIEGDMSSARELTTLAELHYGLGNWPTSENLNSLALAKILIAAADLDADLMREAGDRLLDANEQSSIWHTVGVIARGYGMLFAGQPERALAGTRSAIRSSRTHTGPLLLRSMIVAGSADLLTAAGRPAEALAAMQRSPETPEHSFCLGLRRATANLMLGAPKHALKDTDACLTLGHGHTTRTLAAALLRRAVAHDMLEDHVSAERDFAEALQYIAISRNAGAFHSLDVGILTRLWGALEKRDPELHARTIDLLDGWRAQAQALPRVAVTQSLTGRELAVLHRLGTDATIGRIGEMLFISENTVKTHVRSIYQKFGVSTRREAIQAAQRVGLLSEAGGRTDP